MNYLDILKTIVIIHYIINMYTIDDINYWKNNRNHYTKKSCFVTCKKDFRMICNILSDCDDIAYISIESTPECAEYLKYSHDNKHWLNDKDNVLNIRFDDVDEDLIKDDKIIAKAITEKQAEDIVEFIEKNIGKHFIIHCRAGQSRSQAVYSYIMQRYFHIYGKYPINKINPCNTPNMRVLAMLKREWLKIYYS